MDLEFKQCNSLTLCVLCGKTLRRKTGDRSTNEFCSKLNIMTKLI